MAAAVAYTGVSALNFALIARLRAHLPTLLLILLAVDLAFMVLVLAAATGAATANAAYLLPILAAHGYLLGSRTAFAHAAFATLVLLMSEALIRPPFAPTLLVAALLGAGFFVMAAIGRLLGRNLSAAEALVQERSDALRRLAHVNELVINELDSAVIVLNAAGQITLANPQARRWLMGDDAVLLNGFPIEEISAVLAAEWKRFRSDPGAWDGQPLMLETNRLGVLPRMTSVSLEGSSDTLIILEDATAIEAQAQQIKLAALGRLSAAIAHEIRNPLSAIKQSAQLLGENPTVGDDVRALTRMIDKNTDRIERIIRDVSLLGRRDRSAPKAVALAERLPELLREIAGMIGAPPDHIQFESTARPVALVDWGHLEEMVTNLVANAWRHSTRSPGCVRVWISLLEQTRRCAIGVSDDGPGVPEEHRDKLFEPFFSGSGSTGLGLYIVRELARAGGGRVRLLSPERGATFVLELPLAEESVHAQG